MQQKSQPVSNSSSHDRYSASTSVLPAQEPGRSSDKSALSPQGPSRSLDQSVLSPHQRDRAIARAGAVDIAINLSLAVFKIIVGVISNSIAIISDAVHGLVDTISGVIILASAKIASSRTISKSPSKVARVELAATLIIAGVVIIVGITVLVESIQEIIEPEPVDYSIPTLIILVVSVLGKLGLGLYLKRRGRAVQSDALTAGGVESLNDVLISGAVLASALIYVIWSIDIAAYISAIIAFVILKLGFDLIFEQYHKRKS